jgi:uncharacterized membrane protein HdeD (DUF308 family)
MPSAKKSNEKFNQMMRGGVALLAGAVLLYLSHEVVLNLIFFICGIFFIYYAIAELRMRWVIGATEKLFLKLKKRVGI